MNITYDKKNETVKLEPKTLNDHVIIGELMGIFKTTADQYNGYANGIELTIPIYKLIETLIEKNHERR